jgi:hypothetical protein
MSIIKVNIRKAASKIPATRAGSTFTPKLRLRLPNVNYMVDHRLQFDLPM